MGDCLFLRRGAPPSSGPPKGKTLDEYTWEEISYISSNGLAGEYGFQVGDAKEIILNGTVGSCELNNYQTRAFIIGINHNAELEGNNLIHFQIGLGMLVDGSDIGIALVDDEVNNSGTSPAFRIETVATIAPVWETSYMRNSICGTDLTDYPDTSFLAVIPDDLRAVLKPVTKYSLNVPAKAAVTSDNITAETEYIFLLSEYEICATSNWASQYEAEKQQHYSYYMDTNTRLKAKHNDISQNVAYWTRSPDDNNWVMITALGVSYSMGTTYSYGFAPCFCV